MNKFNVYCIKDLNTNVYSTIQLGLDDDKCKTNLVNNIINMLNNLHDDFKVIPVIENIVSSQFVKLGSIDLLTGDLINEENCVIFDFSNYNVDGFISAYSNSFTDKLINKIESEKNENV